ncbi:MAG: phosphohistidine phosphatase SixA [Bryobacteraceae bacterium]
MQLYILRHGIAEDGHPGGRDSDRALTSEGKKKLRDVLRVASKAGVAPKMIVTSPYVRAVETAEIAADVLGYKDSLLRTDALVPSSETAAVWEELRVHRDTSELMLVGHEPLLSQSVAFLLAAPSMFVDLKKGALVRIDLDQFGVHPKGVLKWMLVPKLV